MGGRGHVGGKLRSYHPAGSGALHTCTNQNPHPHPNPNKGLNTPMDLARIKGHDEIAQFIKGYRTVRARQTGSSRQRVAP